MRRNGEFCLVLSVECRYNKRRLSKTAGFQDPART